MAKGFVRASTLLIGVIISAIVSSYYLFHVHPEGISSVRREPRKDIRWINTIDSNQKTRSPVSSSTETMERQPPPSKDPEVVEETSTTKNVPAVQLRTETRSAPPPTRISPSLPQVKPQANANAPKPLQEAQHILPSTDAIFNKGNLANDKRERDQTNVQAAKIIQQTHPRYPFVAKKRNIEGWVIVSYNITREGKTKNLQIVDAYPTGVFEKSSIEAVKTWLYEPKKINGVAVEEERVKSKINFTLNE